MTASGPPRVMTQALGGSPLSLAVQARRLPAGLQPWWPSRQEEWRGHVDRVRLGAGATWYDRIRPAIAAGGAAAARLERTVAAGGVVVTTGQQAGLFGGPVYTLAKALTALELADAIERQLGVPAAPVFWGATDDADFIEASATHVADAGGLRALALPTRPPAGTTMAVAPLGDTNALLEQLRTACGSAAHAEYLQLARRAFSGKRSIGDAYLILMRGLLEPLGMAVLDSSHPAYLEAARPMLLEALTAATEIAAAATANAAALRGAGFEPQVRDERGLSLVFDVREGVKRRLSMEEAAKIGRGRPVLAPNVLLRPLVERELLPTVAYVAGPAELAYFAQTSAVATALGREAPVGVARWSCTVIEPFVDRALRRLDVEWHEVQDLHGLERRLATQALPSQVTDAWKRLRERTHDAVRDAADAVREAALMPDAVMQGLERSLDHRLSRGERRLLAAAKRRDQRVQTDLTVASAALFPLGSRQERVLNFIPMLVRGGEELLTAMRQAAAQHVDSVLDAAAHVPAAAP